MPCAPLKANIVPFREEKTNTAQTTLAGGGVLLDLKGLFPGYGRRFRSDDPSLTVSAQTNSVYHRLPATFQTLMAEGAPHILASGLELSRISR